MKCGIVYCCGRPAGILAKMSSGFMFRYIPSYCVDPKTPPVSATLPKSRCTYSSKHLFPFFFGLLAEGNQKSRQCRELHVDENDSFSLLLATSRYGAIGAVHVDLPPQNPSRPPC